MTLTEAFSLLGGVGLFLYGMTMMSTGLRQAAGDRIRTILEHVTSNKFMAVLLGIVVTLLIQSSSATDMMVIGFVNSGLMNLIQAIGVIMGANIGTTVTAQITAFDLSAIAPLLLFVGCVAYLFLKKQGVKSIGMIVMGFGMLFVGISLIKQAIAPLSQSPAFVAFLGSLDNPALAVIFGVAFTALLQSSSSATVIFQAFAIQSLLSYHTAVYLIIGAAIGSVTPNLLASLTTNRNGKRTAILNLLFNLFRAAFILLLITLVPQVLTLICSLSPNNVGRQIANTHTLFAIIAVLVELPFAEKIVALAQKIIPVLPEETRSEEARKLQYMVNTTSVLPAVAVRQAMLEITRLGRMATDNLKTAAESFFTDSDALAEQVAATESDIDYLTHLIMDRLVEFRSLRLSESDMFRADKLALITSNFERISDHAENIIEYRDKLEKSKAAVSEAGMADLKRLAEATFKSMEMSLKIFAEEKFDLLSEAEDLEEEVDDLQDEIVQNHIDRLMAEKCDPMAGVVFTDMCTDLERCSDHAINIATALVTRYTRIG